MSSDLPDEFTTPQIRILQEFRRLGQESMTIDEIVAIKHPAGGGEIPAWRLVERGYLQTDEMRQNFTLTESAREFLAEEPKPSV